MGRGPEGSTPLNGLADRVGMVDDAYVNYPKWDDTTRYLRTKGWAPNEYCVLVDTMQLIEGCVHREGYNTGNDIYMKAILPTLQRYLSKERCTCVVLCMDTNKMFNRQKEMDYYPESGKGRKSDTVPLVVEPGTIVLDNDQLPSDWSGMKMNPQLRKQINCYFANRIAGQFNIRYGMGKKTIIVDNVIKDFDICRQVDPFAEPPCEMTWGSGSPDETPHYAMICKYENGARSSQPLLERNLASNIAEAELAMDYWWRVLERPAPSDEEREESGEEVISNLPVYDLFIAATTDNQDALEILLLNEDDHTSNMVIASQMMSTSGPRGRPLEQVKKWWTIYWDAKQTARNIIAYHRMEHRNTRYPVLCEVLFLMMSGGDYSDKVIGKGPNPQVPGKNLQGVSYRFRLKAYLSNVAAFASMFRVCWLTAILNDGSTANLRTVFIDQAIYEQFLRKVLEEKANKPISESALRRKTNRRVTQDMAKKRILAARGVKLRDTWELRRHTRNVRVLARQFMCTITNYANVTRVRHRRKQTFIVDCLCRDTHGDSIWGYEERATANPHVDLAVASADQVARNFFQVSLRTSPDEWRARF